MKKEQETEKERKDERKRREREEEEEKMWKGVQQNIGKFQNTFGRNMFILDNSDGSSFVREIARLGGRLDHAVPPAVERALRERAGS